ncbi:MAG: efflux RND transporter periplasmic adaptor subunit [Patescibacteria group bacterium]
MAESIIKQSKKAKGGGFSGRTKTVVIILILLAGAYYGYSYYTKKNSAANQMMKQQKTATATKGDIQMAVETDGTVVAEDGVELSFSTTGETVEKIYVKEGDTVKKGDKIASISTDSMQYELQNAQDSYKSAVLALADGKAGASEKDIKNSQYQIEQAESNLAQSKTGLEQANTNLEQTKIDAAEKVKDGEDAINDAKEDIDTYDRDSDDAVGDAYSSLRSDIENFSISLKSNLYSADKILGVDDTSLNDDFENVLGVLDTSSLNAAKSSYNTTKYDKQKLDAMLSSTSKTDYDGLDKLAAQAEITADDAKELFVNLQKVLDATITSADLTQNELDSKKSSASSLLTSATGSVSTFDKDLKTIKSAKETVADKETSENDTLNNLQKVYNKAVTGLEDVKRQNEVDISKSESSVVDAQTAIRNKEIALDQAKMNYNDLLSPLTTAELQKLVTQVNQSKNNLKQVQDKIDDATLIAPIDGQVGAINGKEGSLISENSSESFVTIINKDTLFVKVSVEESDIGSISKGQKAYVTFDAVDGLEMEGEVTYISMTAGASNSGVVTYEVRVVLDNVGQTAVMEGMTAFVKFVSDEVKDVLTLPVAAVTNVNGASSVKMSDGTYKEVVTGFTDGQTVEIVEGLAEGDKVVY